MPGKGKGAVTHWRLPGVHDKLTGPRMPINMAVRDMTEAMECYRSEALPLIAAHENKS